MQVATVEEIWTLGSIVYIISSVSISISYTLFVEDSLSESSVELVGK